MTLAEVIDTLQTWIRNADDEYDREEMGRVAGLKEALHEIKRIEPCEDCISRQYLLDNCVVDKVTMPYVPVNKIKNAPPVTLQPKTGRWIIDTKGIITTLYRCSECNRTVIDDTGYSPYKDYPFCHCGAKMIDPQESEVEE